MTSALDVVEMVKGPGGTFQQTKLRKAQQGGQYRPLW